MNPGQAPKQQTPERVRICFDFSVPKSWDCVDMVRESGVEVIPVPVGALMDPVLYLEGRRPVRGSGEILQRLGVEVKK